MRLMNELLETPQKVEEVQLDVLETKFPQSFEVLRTDEVWIIEEENLRYLLETNTLI
jgi:hypothetical protein